MPARHGLANLGNTCYLNSAIQALTATTAFTELFGSKRWETWHHADRNGTELVTMTASMTEMLNTEGTKPIMPVGFARAFVAYAQKINDDIRMGAQADAAEAIQILIDGLHMNLAREVRMDINGPVNNKEKRALAASYESWAQYFRKEYSVLVEAFYGQTQTQIICDGCGAHSTRYEPWNVLKLPIPGAEKEGNPAPTLDECLQAAMAEDTLEDYECESCKKRGPAKMHHAISRFPRHLILSLKRFTNHGKKIRAKIPYNPEEVDLQKFRAWPTLQKPIKYKVQSVIEHLGVMNGGHYLMRKRDASDNQWWQFDDWAVSGPCNGDASPDTYILILDAV